METAVQTAIRRPELLTEVAAAPPTEAPRNLNVTVTYLLSEAGRKTSLLAGGNGRELQELSLEVPATRLHLVTVDSHGVARLKLRPRYEVSGERVVRVDAAPVYDKPPDAEELYRAAAKNHELERAYEAERSAKKTQRREQLREHRASVAQAFLSDTTQRALVHPAPSLKRCLLQSKDGRILFDVEADEGLARDVPPEAHRRFRNDLRLRRERNLQERAAQLALHEEKKRYLADWIAAHGTAEQRARAAAGVLPMNEAIEAVTDSAYVRLNEWQRYVPDGVDRLRSHVASSGEGTHSSVSAADVTVTGTNAVKATADQWAAVQQIQAAVPEATVVLREHTIRWRRNPSITLHVFGVLVTSKVGPLTIRREYAISKPGSKTLHN